MRKQFLSASFALTSLFCGCASTSDNRSPEPAPRHSTEAPAVSPCSGDACAVNAGAMMLMYAMLGPSPVRGGKAQSQTIAGHCEILVEKHSKTGKPQPKPCTDVRIELKGVGKKFDRVAWVQGTDFEVPAVPPGKYTVQAYSEEFQARAELAEVEPGQTVNIQIKVSAAPYPP